MLPALRALGSARTHVDEYAPAYLKTLSDLINGQPVDFFRFCNPAHINGIRDRSNTTDLSSVFASVMASGEREVILQPGLYNMDDTFAITRAFRLLGSGPNATEIKIRSTTESGITLANGIAGYGLRGFKLTRSGVPGSSAHGIEFLGTTDNTKLEWLAAEDHYDNFRLGGCDTGFFHNIESRRAYRFGVFQTNSAVYGPSQWDIDNLLVEKCDNDGFRAQSTSGPAGMILGAMRNIRTFANTGRGIHILGSAITPVFDLRLSDAFCGDDANGCIRLDTYGGKHRLSGFFERAGRGNTGRTLVTVPTNAAPNIDISANNTDMIVSNSTIDEASYDGIQHDGGILIVNGNMIYNNGQGLVGGRRNGILSQGGEVIVTGNRIGNLAGAAQLFGVATGHDDITLTGNNLKGNATAETALGGTIQAVVASNTPNTMPTYP